MTRAITYAKEHNGLSINTNKEKEEGVYTDIVERHHAHMKDMTEKHSKVMQVRFDLRYPQDGSVIPNSKQLQDFNYNLTRKLSREKSVGGHAVDPRIINVKEQHGDNSHPHIHSVILVNGNAKQNYMGLLKQVERTWASAIKSTANGLVDHCNRNGANGLMINRNSDDFQSQLNACSYQASYLAKSRGKEHKAKGDWLVSGTRHPK